MNNHMEQTPYKRQDRAKISGITWNNQQGLWYNNETNTGTMINEALPIPQALLQKQFVAKPQQEDERRCFQSSSNSSNSEDYHIAARMTDDFESPREEDEWEGKTTVMMRNIPNKYTQNLLVEELSESGFSTCYDFLYVPMDIRTNTNRGYAFINFVDGPSALSFKTCYLGKKMRRFNSCKHVLLTPAAIQGFDRNYAHYYTLRVSRGDCTTRPLFTRTPSNASAPSEGVLDVAEPDSRGGSTRRGRGRRGSGKGKKMPSLQELSENEQIDPSWDGLAQENVNNTEAMTAVRLCRLCEERVGVNFAFCHSCGTRLPPMEDSILRFAL
jgi:hypothetical protein